MVVWLSQRHLSVLYIGFIINVSFQKTVICCRIYALVRYGFKDILTLRISLVSSFNGNAVPNTVKNWTNLSRNVFGFIEIVHDVNMNHKLFRLKDINSRPPLKGNQTTVHWRRHCLNQLPALSLPFRILLAIRQLYAAHSSMYIIQHCCIVYTCVV